MQGNSRFRAISIPFILIILIFFSACQATPPPVTDGDISTATSPPEQSFGPFIPVGEKVERNLGTTVEEVRNCIPDNEPIVKTPSRSIVKSHAAEWSVGGRTGVGLTIGEGVLPGGVNLGASIEMTYGQRSAESEEIGDGWQLPAKPGKIVTYILEWTEIWQPGYIELRIADQEVKKIDVLVRTDISSRIQGESVQLCEDFEQSTPTANEVTPLPTDDNKVEPANPTVARTEPVCESSVYVRDANPMGTIKTYVRCPAGEIEYIIQPDDLLLSLEYQCPGTASRSIAYKKDDKLSEGEELAVYRSERFVSQPNCQVYITVQNAVADLMGYTIRQEVVGSLNTAPVVSNDVGSAESRGSCGPSAFGGNLQTSNPRFLRPIGHKSGWISSDPAIVILPDGTQHEFATQFVLIVDDLPFVQLKGVGKNSTGAANTWGCWFLEKDAEFVEESARIDYQRKVSANQRATLFKVGDYGFQLIDQN